MVRAFRRKGLAPRRLLRVAIFVLAAACGAATVFRAARAAAKVGGAPHLTTVLAFVNELRRFHDEITRDRDNLRVAMLGDSMLTSQGGGDPLPVLVQRKLHDIELHLEETPARVHALVMPAVGPSGHYCLADEVLDERPALVVLELNMRSFGPAPPGPIAYTEAAGWVRNRRLLGTVRLPLAYAGITLDRLLFYRLLVAAGADSRWAELLELQAHFFRLRARVEGALDPAGTSSGSDRVRAEYLRMVNLLIPGRNRDAPEHLLEMLGDTLDGMEEEHPRLRVLSAALDAYRRRGVPALVWVSPMNLQYIRALGLSLAGTDRTMITLRRAVEKHGGSFLDLHGLLPDAAFVDSGDHFSTNGPIDGAERVAERLAPAIVAALHHG